MTPRELGWKPHRPATWTARYGTTTRPVITRHFTGVHGTDGPVMDETTHPAGTRVRINMVSRFDDVGVTDDLDAEGRYAARVHLDDLTDLAMSRDGT